MRIWSSAVAVFFLLSAAGPAAAFNESDALVQIGKERAAIAADFAQHAAACVPRNDGFFYPVFNGCADWHSAVHGVWALTAYTWATGDGQYKKLILDTLQPEGLAAERSYVNRHPQFEMPYGRAWFLRLAIDYRRAFGDDRLDGLADDIAKSLIAYYTKNSPSPKTVGYGNASWALINLYDYGQAFNKKDIVHFVKKKVEDNYLQDGSCDLQASETSTGEFMSVCSNWAWLVARIETPKEFAVWVDRFLPPGASYAPLATFTSHHQAALNFSRAWGFWGIYRKSGDPRFLQAYREHLDAGFGNKKSWDGDYIAVGHWVPQFGMMAVMVTYYDWPAPVKNKN